MRVQPLLRPIAGAIIVGLITIVGISSGAATMGNMGSVSSMPAMALSSPPPLAGGVTDSSVSMAIVPMGHLGDRANTFYETFTTTGSSWALTTPAAIATNGGLALSSPSKGIVAVLPFYASRLTALSALVAGQPSGDGEVLSPLAPSPSSVAVDPLTGSIATLSAKGVVREQASLTSALHSVTTLSDVRSMSGANRCGVQAITALSYEASGQLGLGVRCSKSGTTAVMIQTGASSFQMIAAPSYGVNAVIRLDPDGPGLLALVRTGGMKASLRAVSIVGSTVSVSSPVSFMDLSIRSTAVSASSSSGSSDIVTLVGTRHAEAVVLTPGILTARVAASLPLATQSVVSTATTGDVASGLTAFEVQNGSATIQTYGTAGEWTTQSVQHVSIPYGSSE